MEPLPDLYPLTSLQIGDIQSYISRAFIYFAPSSHKFLILVDNQPWVMSKHSRSTRIWHIIVTKYRMSPFTNTRSLTHTPNLTNKESCSISPKHKSKIRYRWSSVINVARWPEKSLVHWIDSCKNLHGFIVFEVSWEDVRGINYYNELQTDTSLALEVKSMRKWEFNCINHALSCISLWFSGTSLEMKSLHCGLNDLFDGDPHSNCCQKFSDNSKELLFNRRCPFEVLSEDIFFDVGESEVDNLSECSPLSGDKGCLNGGFRKDRLLEDSDNGNRETCMKEESDIASRICNDNCTYPFEVPSEDIFFDVGDCQVEEDNTSGYSHSSDDKECLTGEFSRDHQVENCIDEKTDTGMKVEFDIASTIYNDNLLLVRFSDRDVPFKLRQVITSDLRLLTLLEFGLPAWVIFLQSYPLFCHFYRPWMRPLVRTLYVLMSLITVIIGFYDLYKNIPILKETLSHLCGPLFKWVEAWDMISRIRYLGTMLFLQNFEKAVKWFLIMMRTIRLLLSLFLSPLISTFMDISAFMSPIWSIFTDIGAPFSSTVWTTLASLCITFMDLVKVLLSPFALLYSFILTIVTSVYPVINSIWELLLAPIRLTYALANYLAFWFSNICILLRGFFTSASSMTRLMKFSCSKPGPSEISVWHVLWKDLISKVFRALRSVIYGLVAFFAICNRHRLSIYNHMRVFFLQLCCRLRLGHYDCHCQQRMQIEDKLVGDSKECNRCK